MEIQLAVLCDAATDYQGKLNLLGTFDAIVARQFPTIHPAAAFVARFLYYPSEQGTHRIRLQVIDEDGNEIAPPAELQAAVQFPPGDRPFISQNMVLNLQRIRFSAPGRFSFELSVDGEHLASVPLLVVQHPQTAGPAANQGEPED